jgi:NitT/TauT family transport system substrate-binding protein
MTRIAAIALGALLLLCAQRSFAQTSPPLPVIRVASAPSDDMSPILYADKAGLFKAAGIAVDVQKASSGSAVAAAVAAGAVDIGKSSLVPLISAHGRGFPFTIVAPSAIYLASNPSSAIIVPKNGAIRSAHDLSGKTVSVAGLQDLNWLGTQVWIDKNGGDTKAVHFLEVPITSVAAALDSSRVDAATLQNPVLAQDLESGKYRVLGCMINAIAPRVLQSAWFTTDSYAAKNRDLIGRFVRVLRQSSEYTNRHPDETVDLLASFTGMEPATIRHMARAIAGTSLEPREVQPMIDAAAKYKLIEKPFPAREFISEYMR